MNLTDRLHMLHRFWRYRRRSERSSVQYLLAQDLTGTTVLDIGANKGIYSYWMSRKVGADGTVFAFEPQPEMGPFLEDLKATFKLHNVIVVNKGLSDRPGRLPMYRMAAGHGGSHFSENPQGPAGWEQIDVEVTTLDAFMSDRPVDAISFVKCDVEGHELKVFQGGEETLRKHRPILLFECGHDRATEGDTFRFLAGLGYEGFFFHGKNRIDYKEFDRYSYRTPTERHRNYIFVA